jgi:hypothetical protein
MYDDKAGESSKSRRAGAPAGAGEPGHVTSSSAGGGEPLRPEKGGPILGRMRHLAHAAAVGTISLLVLTGYHFFQSTPASVASTVSDEHDAPGGLSGFLPRNFSALGGGYRLSDLKNLHRADYYIREAYVDPDRIDAAAMFRSALEAVEREVPEVVLRLEGDPASANQRLYVAWRRSSSGLP